MTQALSKQQLETLRVLFDAAKAADETVSADVATDIVREVTQRESLSAKTVRAHLRKTKARDQSKYKQATWHIKFDLLAKTAAAFNRKTIEASK